MLWAISPDGNTKGQEDSRSEGAIIISHVGHTSCTRQCTCGWDFDRGILASQGPSGACCWSSWRQISLRCELKDKLPEKEPKGKVNVNHFMADAAARFRFYDSFSWNFNPKDIFIYLWSPFLLNSFMLCAKLQVKRNSILCRNWSHRPTFAAQIFNHSQNCKDQAPASSVRIPLKQKVPREAPSFNFNRIAAKVWATQHTYTGSRTSQGLCKMDFVLGGLHN